MSDALLVIDVQQALVDWLEEPRRSEYIGTLSGIIARARTAGVPLVYVRHGDDELRPGTPGWQIAAAIGPLSGEPIVDKRFRDAFRDTDLVEVLAKLGADHLIVTGMQTDYCVDASIREAERRGYRVTLVEDGTATYAAGSLSEMQIQEHVQRIARDTVAAIVPSTALFTTAAQLPSG